MSTVSMPARLSAIVYNMSMYVSIWLSVICLSFFLPIYISTSMYACLQICPSVNRTTTGIDVTREASRHPTADSRQQTAHSRQQALMHFAHLSDRRMWRTPERSPPSCPSSTTPSLSALCCLLPAICSLLSSLMVLVC
jgi:hypothetical protein